MKILIVAFCFVGALSALELTDEQKALLKKYKKACVAKTGVRPELIENTKMDDVNTNDQNINCFIACMFKKAKMMNEDGSLNEEITRQYVPPNFSKQQMERIHSDCKAARRRISWTKDDSTNSPPGFIENLFVLIR